VGGDGAGQRSTIDYGALQGDRNGGPPAAPERTLADLTDAELLVTFPGATIEDADVLRSEISTCGCRQRTREWRLRGEAAEPTYSRLSRKAYREAAEQALSDGGGVVVKGPQSGWVWTTTATGRGHPWTCGLCHPPPAGLDVEWREADR
jgi:hypothetical protein